MAKRAAPIRVMLMGLLKESLRTRQEKEALAKYMGTSLHYVHSMIYYGEGGLDAWVNALIFCFGLEPYKLRGFLEKGRKSVKTKVAEPGKVWKKMETTLSTHEKNRWGRILQAAIRADRGT